jgi:hypothetical protein
MVAEGGPALRALASNGGWGAVSDSALQTTGGNPALSVSVPVAIGDRDGPPYMIPGPRSPAFEQ